MTSAGKKTLWAWTLSTLVLASSSACNGPPRRLVIDAGRVIDGTGAAVQRLQRVTIENGAITSIAGIDGLPPTDSGYIDARSATLMPGIINAHVHLFMDGGCAPQVGVGIGAALRNLEALLRSGVTTAADLSAPREAAVGLKRWVGTGRDRGPRLLVAGPLITARGGYFTNVLDGAIVRDGAIREVATAEEARTVVQGLAEGDVDLIKVGLQDVHYDQTPLPLMSREVLCALVSEAHAQDLRVVAHAVNERTYTLALDCQVDALAHGSLEPLSPELISRVSAMRLPLMPTLFVFEAMLWGPKHLDFYEQESVQRVMDEESLASLRRYAAKDDGTSDYLPASMIDHVPRRSAVIAAAANRANTTALWRAGAALALGTDGGNCMNPLASLLPEMNRLAETGLTPLEVLSAATSGSARLLGLQDALGRVAAGYRADLIVVRGAPDENLEDMEGIEHVIIDGIEQSRELPWHARLSASIRILWTYLFS